MDQQGIIIFLFLGELTSIIQRSALDYKASPSVSKKCKHSIEVCKQRTRDFDGSQDDFEDGGVIEGMFRKQFPLVGELYSCFMRYIHVIPYIKECLRMMFQSNKLSQQDQDCPKLIAQRIQVSEVDSMIDPILQV